MVKISGNALFIKLTMLNVDCELIRMGSEKCFHYCFLKTIEMRLSYIRTCRFLAIENSEKSWSVPPYKKKFNEFPNTYKIRIEWHHLKPCTWIYKLIWKWINKQNISLPIFFFYDKSRMIKFRVKQKK